MKKMTKMGIAMTVVTLLTVAANSAMAASCRYVWWCDYFGNCWYRWFCRY